MELKTPRMPSGGIKLPQAFVQLDILPQTVRMIASHRCVWLEGQIKPVLKIAEHFFTAPPEIMQGHEGLDSLLDEAYLAHRLVEEVNDLYIKHFGQPLIPSNTTVASVIAHQLIGEQFANQLDEAVHHAVDQLLDDEDFALDSVEAYREKLSSPDTEAAWKRWPSLSRQLGIGLELERSAG